MFRVTIPAWPEGGPIPARFAFGQPGTDGPFALADNVSPEVRWTEPPEGTQSFALICVDPDVPSVGDDVNQAGRLVPADLPRVDFFHWVVADIPAELRGLQEGAGSTGVVPRGKAVGDVAFGVVGRNTYTAWFAGDADMDGTYGNYDGPCPPWNDSIVHHYHVRVFALDVPTLGLSGPFSGEDLRAAMAGHVLGMASAMGTYSMNPAVD